MNNHVLPILGKTRIYELHQKDIEDFIHQEIRICDERSLQRQKIREEAEKSGKKPSFSSQDAPFYKSIKKHVNVLSQMLKYAVTVDDIPYNVADKIDKAIFANWGANNLKRIRFHDLRHISGSIVLNSTGDLKLTSEYLRHSSIQVTGDIYSHVDLGRKKTAADILAATIVSGSSTSTTK